MLSQSLSIFGVSNDKQGVRNVGPLSKSVRDEDGITEEDVKNYMNKVRVKSFVTTVSK